MPWTSKILKTALDPMSSITVLNKASEGSLQLPQEVQVGQRGWRTFAWWTVCLRSRRRRRMRGGRRGWQQLICTLSEEGLDCWESPQGNWWHSASALRHPQNPSVAHINHTQILYPYSVFYLANLLINLLHLFIYVLYLFILFIRWTTAGCLAKERKITTLFYYNGQHL